MFPIRLSCLVNNFQSCSIGSVTISNDLYDSWDYKIYIRTKLMNMNDFNLSDSQINEYFKQMKIDGFQKEYDSNSELQTLLQSTLNLQYQIFLSQEELKMMKLILTEKDCEVKRLKQKFVKKNMKVNSLNQLIVKTNKKINQVKQGYQKISSQNKQYNSSQQAQRSSRLNYQLRKTNLYSKYCELQQNFTNLLLQIGDFGQIQQQYNQLKSENEQMQKSIQQLLDRKKETLNEQIIDRKEHLKNEVKKMYEKIKMTEKEDQSICQEYQANRRAFNQLQKSQKIINNKNLQMQNLYNRIQRAKEQLKLKKWEKTQKQRQLHQVSQEEIQLRKQFNAQTQYRQNQRKLKQNLNHNFKIIDSQADQQITKAGQKFINHYQSCNIQSQEQLDQLIHRFQKIKSKSKNAT